jgi:hypothetical protein
MVQLEDQSGAMVQVSVDYCCTEFVARSIVSRHTQVVQAVLYIVER